MEGFLNPAATDRASGRFFSGDGDCSGRGFVAGCDLDDDFSALGLEMSPRLVLVECMSSMASRSVCERSDCCVSALEVESLDSCFRWVRTQSTDERRSFSSTCVSLMLSTMVSTCGWRNGGSIVIQSQHDGGGFMLVSYRHFTDLARSESPRFSENSLSRAWSMCWVTDIPQTQLKPI